MDDFGFKENTAADVHSYKCPSCGAQMEFSPENQALICPHCKTQAAVQFSSNVTERDFAELYNQRWSGNDVKIVKCENCGAEETLAKKEISTRCPFCGSNTVLKQSEMSGVKPDTVIPFKITKETAIQKCLKWLGSKFFSPKKFKRDLSINTVDGVYNPIWTFDSNTRTNYSGVLGKRVTTTVVVNGKTQTKTEMKWFPVRGTIDCAFDDIYIPASERMNEKLIDKLKPYDQRTYVKYNDGMLAGFAAANYTVQPLDAWKKAEQRMYNHIRQLIIRKHNADAVQSLNMQVNHLKKSFKYLMLPVYVAATYYKEKLYNLYVNGVHGKVAGKAPVSAAKVLLTIAIPLAILLAAGLLMKLFGG